MSSAPEAPGAELPADVTDEAVTPFLLELFSPEARADPYPLYHRQRAIDPVHRSPMGIWTITGHAQALEVLRDPRFSADPRNSTAIQAFISSGGDGANPIANAAGRVLLFTDPPDHTRMRTLVNKAFTARVVEGLRPRIQELVDDLFGAVADRGAMDVIADLAYPLPVFVICELMGVPAADREDFRRWSTDAVVILDPMPAPDRLERAVEALGHFDEYFKSLVADRRRRPRDDLLSAMIAAEDDEDRLTEEELLSLSGLIFIAGHETTQNLIGNGLLGLLRHPAEMRRLRDDPSLARNAVEEMLRYDSPVQLTGRSALSDVDIDGRTIAKGEETVILLGAANRDPEVFDDPDRLDVGRERPQHLSFSGGIHFCLGAGLARVEAQIAFETLLRRTSEIELADEPSWRDTVTLRGMRSLEVRF